MAHVGDIEYLNLISVTNLMHNSFIL